MVLIIHFINYFISFTAVISEDNLDFFITEDREIEIKRTRKTAQRVQQEILMLLHDDTHGEPSIAPPAAKELILQVNSTINRSLLFLIVHINKLKFK